MKPLLITLLAGTALLQAAPLTIQNAGFETGNLTQVGNGTFSQLVASSTIFAQGGTLNNWTVATTNTNAAAGGFSPSPGGLNWTSTWWSGNNIAFLQRSTAGTVSLSQVLTDTLTNDTVYTLSALIGRRIFTPTLNYSLQLLAGNTVLASASNLSLAGNSFGSDSLVFSSGSNNALAGQALAIRLSTTSTGGFTEAFFDNVALDAVTTSPNVPEPTTLGLMLAGVAGILLWGKRV